MQKELLEIAKEEGMDIGTLLDRDLQAQRNFKTAYWRDMNLIQLNKEAKDYGHEQVCLEMMSMTQYKYIMRMDNAETD